jgi:membrane protein implicated in regulation of membrane protease activity
MAGAAGLDVRMPIGGLFAVLGLMIGGYGLATAGDAAHYVKSLSLNVNLWWGLVLLAFGVLMLVGAIRSHRRASVRPALETPEGQATEQRERRAGLER